MAKKSPEFDAYIAAAAPFARPILKKLRTLFHRACPDIEEQMKWRFPHFLHHGIVGSMAAFKQHVRFHFWRGNELPDSKGLFNDLGETGMSAGRVESLEDLPADAVLLRLIQAAASLNEAGPAKKPARKKAVKRPPPEIPTDFQSALRRNAAAKKAFEAFSPSHQREYVEWITEAKQQATRERRIATALEWLADGKSRHWKYEKC